MTLEQLYWASEQFWFERSGEDTIGRYVVGRDCWGSRPALIFYDFNKLIEWASGQRNLGGEIANGRECETPMKNTAVVRRSRGGRMLVMACIVLVVACALWLASTPMNT